MHNLQKPGYAFGNMAPFETASARQSSSAPALIISLFVLAAVAAGLFYFNPHKVAELRVTGVDTYAPHTTFNNAEPASAAPNGMHVLDAPTTTSEDNLYLIAKVTMTNKLRLPIFISGATAHVTLADGSQVESSILSSTDLKRLEVIFPDIREHAVAPVFDGDQIDPGKTRVGTIVLPFPGQTADFWHAKKSAKLTIDLRNQDPQTTDLP